LNEYKEWHPLYDFDDERKKQPPTLSGERNSYRWTGKYGKINREEQDRQPELAVFVFHTLGSLVKNVV